MGITRIEPEQVCREALESVWLSDAFDIRSPEATAGLIRRAAGFLCPTTPATLTRAVRDITRGLPGVTDDRADVRSIVDSLVSHGDLLELPVDDGVRSQRLLFLGPPTFVPLHASALLLGIRADGAPLISDELLGDIEHTGHVRRIRSGEPAITDVLIAEGLVERTLDQWLQAPRDAEHADVIGYYSDRLEAAGPSGDIEGVTVIDPLASVSFYRGRWRGLGPRDAGRFVARRPQAFGSDLWCFVRVADGAVTRLLDLPLQSPLATGADEAWRLQAALDAAAGNPQRVRVRPDKEASIVDFFSPVPSWVQRRLDVIGSANQRGSGALFSYRVPEDELGEELQHLRTMMWLSAEGPSDGEANAQ